MNRVEAKITYHMSRANELRPIVMEALDLMEAKLREHGYDFEYQVHEMFGRFFSLSIDRKEGQDVWKKSETP